MKVAQSVLDYLKAQRYHLWAGGFGIRSDWPPRAHRGSWLDEKGSQYLELTISKGHDALS